MSLSVEGVVAFVLQSTECPCYFKGVLCCGSFVALLMLGEQVSICRYVMCVLESATEMDQTAYGSNLTFSCSSLSLFTVYYLASPTVCQYNYLCTSSL